MKPRKRVTVLLAALLLFGACGADNGGEVRTIDDSGGSVSISATGSGTETGVASPTRSPSPSASPSGPTSVSAASPHGTMGAYQPLSDVSSHARAVLDVCEISGLLPKDEPIDYPAVKAIYENGVNSTKGDGSFRTIAGFARSERDEAIWNDYVSYYGDPTWLDTFTMSAIDGTGAFAGEPDLIRRQGIQKGIQNQIMIAWTIHELVAALDKAADGNFDVDSGAPHNWDEGWAFYHGDAPDCGPFTTADQLGANFGTGSAVNDALALSLIHI